MSKHNRQTRKIPTSSFHIQASAFNKERYALLCMKAEKYFLPEILQKKMILSEALVLIAVYAYGTLVGKKSLYEQDIIYATKTLQYLWYEGLFRPSATFPYTLEDMIKDVLERNEEEGKL